MAATEQSSNADDGSVLTAKRKDSSFSVSSFIISLQSLCEVFKRTGARFLEYICFSEGGSEIRFTERTFRC